VHNAVRRVPFVIRVISPFFHDHVLAIGGLDCLLTNEVFHLHMSVNVLPVELQHPLPVTGEFNLNTFRDLKRVTEECLPKLRRLTGKCYPRNLAGVGVSVGVPLAVLGKRTIERPIKDWSLKSGAPRIARKWLKFIRLAKSRFAPIASKQLLGECIPRNRLFD